MHTFRKSLLTAGVLTLTIVAAGCTTVPASPQAGGQAELASPVAATLTVNDKARALLPTTIREAGVLKIASDPTYPPFEYFDTDNKTMIGWDVDMGNAIAAVLGLKADHVPATFDTILPGLTSHKYDLGMSAFSVTPERAKAVDFVPYLDNGTGLAVAPKNPLKLAIEGLTLCGQKVAAQKGSIQSMDLIPQLSKKCTDAGKPALEAQNFPTQTDANLALTSGRVSGVLADSVSLAYQGKLADGRFELGAGADFDPLPTGTALNKGSELLPAIQEATRLVVESPAFAEINAKWGIPAAATISANKIVQK
ncbi:ABC transporter substrate-binding protein [Arthrobacter wenxiniae]|uniref:ABC transporter substrate-binding protein n=1 Tax=Arthrobacter wenxiniae TaxID=2713570 RepID=A0A7Y7LZW6_9MICC|nr:ABC transporter substrate-binding protein [Arthrobacter wenxiniae]NVM96427.1 ABC transporter substrate-binding protein [Arthrobacter wenxiniae]